MKSKNVLCGVAIAVVLHLGVLAGSAQTNKYLFSGAETNITLPPGTYIITAYGAPGAFPSFSYGALGGWGGSGAEMSAEFNFSTSTTLALWVGGGDGGGTIIDSSAITILAEVSGVFSPDAPPNLNQSNSGNGRIIITEVPTPVAITTDATFGFTNGVFGFDVIGPSGSNVVVQASTDLQTWIPLQTNLLGSGPLYISDAQSTTSVQRFYRVQLSP